MTTTPIHIISKLRSSENKRVLEAGGGTPRARLAQRWNTQEHWFDPCSPGRR